MRGALTQLQVPWSATSGPLRLAPAPCARLTAVCHFPISFVNSSALTPTAFHDAAIASNHDDITAEDLTAGTAYKIAVRSMSGAAAFTVDTDPLG